MTRLFGAMENLVIPFLILGLAVLWVVSLAGGISPSFRDLLERGAPAVLIGMGMALLMGRRVRFGNLIAASVTVVLLVGVAAIAYGREGSLLREDYIEPIDYALAPDINAVKIVASVRRTAVEIVPGDQRAIGGRFSGGLESLIALEYQVESGVATLTIRETARSNFPTIEQVGRGALRIVLPANVPLTALELSGEDGDLTYNGETVIVKEFRADFASGNLTARFSDATGLIADLKTGNGSITVAVPDTLPSEITLRGGGVGSAQFDPSRYTLRIDNVLIPASGANPQAQISVETNGAMTIQ
ncbi:MAG: hypothetical protein OHK0023_13150 [Anaerolineae bacterium]